MFTKSYIRGEAARIYNVSEDSIKVVLLQDSRCVLLLIYSEIIWSEELSDKLEEFYDDIADKGWKLALPLFFPVEVNPWKQ